MMSILFTKTQQYLIKKNKRLTINTSKTAYPSSSESADILPSKMMIETHRTQHLLD